MGKYTSGTGTGEYGYTVGQGEGRGSQRRASVALARATGVEVDAARFAPMPMLFGTDIEGAVCAIEAKRTKEFPEVSWSRTRPVYGNLRWNDFSWMNALGKNKAFAVGVVGQQKLVHAWPH